MWLPAVKNAPTDTFIRSVGDLSEPRIPVLMVGATVAITISVLVWAMVHLALDAAG